MDYAKTDRMACTTADVKIALELEQAITAATSPLVMPTLSGSSQSLSTPVTLSTLVLTSPSFPTQMSHSNFDITRTNSDQTITNSDMTRTNSDQTTTNFDITRTNSALSVVATTPSSPVLTSVLTTVTPYLPFSDFQPHFVTELYFFTLYTLHIGLIKAVKTMDKLYNQIGDVLRELEYVWEIIHTK